MRRLLETEKLRALLAEEVVRHEFLSLCREAQLRPPTDLSLEGMAGFIEALDEGKLAQKIKKGFKMVFGKIQKIGKTAALAGAVATAAMGHDMPHHRPERDPHGGISFNTPAQQSRGGGGGGQQHHALRKSR